MILKRLEILAFSLLFLFGSPWLHTIAFNNFMMAIPEVDPATGHVLVLIATIILGMITAVWMGFITP